MTIAYNLTGRIWTFCRVINVANASYNAAYDLIIPFTTESIILFNKGTTAVIDVSTNGQDSGLLIRLDAADANTKSVPFYNIAVNQLWFKLVSGSAADLMISAWATRGG